MKKRNVFISLVAVILAATLVYGASTVTKGLIGKQDMALWYSGDSASTFTRSTSEGYTLTLNKLDWVGADAFQVWGGGVNKTRAVLASAQSDIDTTSTRTLWLAPGTWTIDDDLTFASYPNLFIHMAPGAIFSVSTGKTLTLYSPANIIAQPNQQIFSGAGTIAFSTGVGKVYPNQWKQNITPGTTDMTAAIQTALDSGAGSVGFLYETYDFTTVTVPDTVKELSGVGGHRGATILQASGTETSALIVDSDGINVSNLYVVCTGTYTNGIVISTGRHFTTWDKVTTGGAFVNHWSLSNNCWSQVFRHCGAWGTDNAAEVGFKIGSSGNALDFYSCRFIHAGTGVYLFGDSIELVNFYGGEIASNVTYGVRIGQGAASSGIEALNFYSTYFEDQPINIYNDMPEMVGIGCYGCRNSETDLTAHIFLNRPAHGINIIGGRYMSTHAGSGTLLDGNSTTCRDVTILTPYVSGLYLYTNATNFTGFNVYHDSDTKIGFPATQVASANVNTLDDYEEGTWTPNVGGDATYTKQQGRYVKIGKMVFFTADMTINVIGTGSTSKMEGLPYTSVNATPAAQVQPIYVSYFSDLAIDILFIAGYVENNATSILFTYNNTAATTMQSAAGAIFGNSANIVLSGFYEAAQ